MRALALPLLAACACGAPPGGAGVCARYQPTPSRTGVNPAVLPRLKDGGTKVTFEASGQAVLSAGPNLPQAQAHLVEGAFGTPAVTLELRSPRGEPATAKPVSRNLKGREMQST